MTPVELVLLVEDDELEKRIEDLDQRCKKLDISLQGIFQATAMTMPYKPFVDILIGLSDLKISDIEENERMEHFWNKFKIYKKNKEET